MSTDDGIRDLTIAGDYTVLRSCYVDVCRFFRDNAPVLLVARCTMALCSAKNIALLYTAQISDLYD